MTPGENPPFADLRPRGQANLADILGRQEHRPWPLPDRPWLIFQSWQDLLFAHWPIPASQMAELLPAGLALDTYAGEAWVTVVPFRMSGVRPRLLPAAPGLSSFPELNVRTYVRVVMQRSHGQESSFQPGRGQFDGSCDGPQILSSALFSGADGMQEQE